MSKPKYLITNLVYGDTYARLFLNNHLKSLLDPTNLPAIAEKYDIEMMLFTDQTTVKMLSYHPNTLALSKLLSDNGGKLTSYLFQWPNNAVNKVAYRYGLILNMVHASIKKALEDKALLTCWVADLVVAKEFFPRIVKRIDEGHDAVFVLPARAMAEPLGPKLLEHQGALSDQELFALCLECLHPLWEACHWNTPRFSKLPFCLIWNTIGGLMVRTFSTTPIIFKPKEAMLKSRGMIDGDIPQFLENPYWATNWIDAPVIGVEPLGCYAPTGANRPSSIGLIEDFTANIHDSQKPFLKHRCFYPDEKTVGISVEALKQSDDVVAGILGESCQTN